MKVDHHDHMKPVIPCLKKALEATGFTGVRVGWDGEYFDFICNQRDKWQTVTVAYALCLLADYTSKLMAEQEAGIDAAKPA